MTGLFSSRKEQIAELLDLCERCNVKSEQFHGVPVSGIATSKEVALVLVQRLVMQAVFDVLEMQSRSAFLPDAVISGILNRLTVNITYEALQYQKVAPNPTADMRAIPYSTLI
ncbi:hypothetical protein KIN20_017386 [Parelaphostrongylus tenuis]|uniref:Uncharacterized protein n=1 Tax=Parelaphostrongylus tenuis TaxID=148309 RepID=A0AAD5MHV7_PARTN|nr:hypothetical protein KIN20_017386 [Parelaphostrongylus tenuis]